MLHTKYQGFRSSDFSQEELSPLLGLTVSDKKDFPVEMLNYAAHIGDLHLYFIAPVIYLIIRLNY